MACTYLFLQNNVVPIAGFGTVSVLAVPLVNAQRGFLVRLTLPSMANQAHLRLQPKTPPRTENPLL